jgi:thiol-disulfide isomerase/thioredoxin
LLVRDVVDRFGGKVGYRVENWGESTLAARFGVARYPAVFVNDAVFALPRDFGFYGGTESSGRYTPWRDPASHERFRQDLVKLLDRVLAGEKVPGGKAVPADAALARLPDFSLPGLDGAPIAAATLRGRPAVVEFWATWCVPCKTTLPFLAKLAAEHPDLAVVAVAVESDEKDVRAMTSSFGPAMQVAMGTPETARAFGDLTAVPTTFLVDAEGRIVSTLYGSPPGLEERLRQEVERLLQR